MKPFFLYIRLCLLCLGIATVASCNLFTKEEPIDCPSQTEYYYLDAEAKAQIPYKGYDTIRMVSNTEDTLHFIGTGKQPFTTQTFELYGNPACGNNGTTRVYEAYTIKFVDKSESLEYKALYESDNLEINFDGSFFQFSYYDVSNKNIGYVKLFDSPIIRQKTYYLVNEFTSVNDSNDKLLFNKQFGILKFSLNNNLTILEKL